MDSNNILQRGRNLFYSKIDVEILKYELTNWVNESSCSEKYGRSEAMSRIMSAYNNRSDSLDLSQLSLSSIPLGINKLFFITNIKMNKNQITEIKENTFNGLVYLRNLYLSENQITKIKENAFNGLVKLYQLKLNHNQITKIDAKAFGGLKQLYTLGLNNNQITEFKVNVSNGKLRVLDLYDNKITKIEANAFKRLKGLQSLFFKRKPNKEL
ncbi:MAG: leucine-rich repeat domain-containing protein [Neisseriaceae bacterium]|jgi:Leucine-rich repeat (LRR) protein